METKKKVAENSDTLVTRSYRKFYKKNGYIPEMFNPYNCVEITDIAPTQTTSCGGVCSSATVLILERDYDENI